MKVYIKISSHRDKKEKSKMHGLHSINSHPMNNWHCMARCVRPGTVCHYCYAIYGLYTYRENCNDVFKHNDIILSHRVLTDREIPFMNYGIIRFNSYGELINKNHFLNYCSIARNNKHCSFTLYTKEKSIVKKYHSHIPANMILIYSSVHLNKPEKLPEHFNKVFTVYTTDYISRTNIDINCIGQCINCMKCYDSADRTIHIHDVVKSRVFKAFDKIRHKVKWTIYLDNY